MQTDIYGKIERQTDRQIDRPIERKLILNVLGAGKGVSRKTAV